jgi:hypothetical protein
MTDRKALDIINGHLDMPAASPIAHLTLPSMPLAEFLKEDIPEISYWARGLLQEYGKTSISATNNVGKSMFAQNLSLCFALGKGQYLGRFDIEPKKVYFLDFEMCNSALSQRFKKMCGKEDCDCNNLIIKHTPRIDILNPKGMEFIEQELSKWQPEILFIDPLNKLWTGDMNKAIQVNELTARLDYIRQKFGIGLFIVHHWRKGTRGFTSGGEMASGSHNWSDWLDNHVTMVTQGGNVILSCEKSRNSPRWNPFRIKLNDKTMWFEFVGDFEKKFTRNSLVYLFEQATGKMGDKILQSKLCKYAKESDYCSEEKVRQLVNEDMKSEVPVFVKVPHKRTFWIIRKPRQTTFVQQGGELRQDELFTGIDD